MIKQNKSAERLIRTTLLMGFLLTLPKVGSGQAANDTSGLFKIHLDLRGVVSEGKRLRMGGASLGWEFGRKRDEVTFGYYWTGKRGRKDIQNLSAPPTPLPLSGLNPEINVRFFQVGYWLTLRDWKRWKLSTPLEAGWGNIIFTTPSYGQSANLIDTRKDKIYPVQAALYGEWKATRWLGTGVHVGYRHYFSPAEDLTVKSLNGIYYRFRVLLYIQTLHDWRNFVFKKQPLASPFY